MYVGKTLSLIFLFSWGIERLEHFLGRGGGLAMGKWGNLENWASNCYDGR